MKPGQRVRVNDRIQKGIGALPSVGALGHVEQVTVAGSVIVKLDDGRRALLASWEVDEVHEAEA